MSDGNDLQHVREHGGVASIRLGIADDLFVVCASYEERTSTATLALADDYRADHAAIYCNREFLSGGASDAVRSARALLRETLSSKCGTVTDADGSWLKAHEQVQAMREVLFGVDQTANLEAVTIDATTFNREALLTCVGMMRARCPQVRIRVLYVSPASHGDWLSRGFRSVRSVSGFPGIQRPTLPTSVVVLSGFERDRAAKLIEEYEPNNVHYGLGDPPTQKQFLKRNVSEQELILARQDVSEFRFPANSVVGTAEALSKLIVPQLEEFNFVLAPMSTKLSTLGALLIAERYPELQIAYCVPGEYNYQEYSTGAADIFIEEMPIPVAFSTHNDDEFSRPMN